MQVKQVMHLKFYLNGEKIPVVDSDKHLGNFISTNIADRKITESVCDLYKRNNWVISDFIAYDSSTLVSLHRTYCMHMYGCELWDLNWANNAIIDNLSYNIDLQFDTRTMKFVHLCLNHCIRVCNSLLSAKPHCTKSRFAANYKHLSYKYKISR